MAATLSSPVAPNSIIPLQGRSPPAFVRYLLANILNALRRLDLTLSPAVTVRHLRRRRWSLRTDYGWILFALEAVFCLWVMEAPAFPLKLLIPAGYALITLVPFLGQFFVPGSYVLAWVLLFFSSKDIPVAWRPAVHVALLPTLESVLYGAVRRPYLPPSPPRVLPHALTSSLLVAPPAHHRTSRTSSRATRTRCSTSSPGCRTACCTLSCRSSSPPSRSSLARAGPSTSGARRSAS